MKLHTNTPEESKSLIKTSDQTEHLRVARKRVNKCSGFTLLESATALLIMGLMLGGVMKSQEIVGLGIAHNLEEDFRNIPVSINEYQGKFNFLPGDDPTIGAANAHLADAVSCGMPKVGSCIRGNSIIDGNWNDNTIASESFLLWQQIRMAGFAAGETNVGATNYLPKNYVGGAIGVTNQTASPIAGLKGAYIICSDHISGKFVRQLDVALDDGNTATGSMMAAISGLAAIGVALPTYKIDESSLYLVCMGI